MKKGADSNGPLLYFNILLGHPHLLSPMRNGWPEWEDQREEGTVKPQELVSPGWATLGGTLMNIELRRFG